MKFVTDISKTTPARVACQEENHKMLWVVTEQAPRTGDARKEGLTIRIFLTGFPQPDLRIPLGTLVEIYM
jgi:hypothetical protein